MSRMPTPPDIRILSLEHGPVPGARALNPRFQEGRPLLRAALRIAWSPDDPRAAVRRVEERLLAFSPGLGRHECRGLRGYHAFRSGADVQDFGAGFEAPLALAHLVEHAIIDFQCGISGETLCSGITGARRAPQDLFDVIVECADPRLGRSCLALAIAWLTRAADGRPPGRSEREILMAARLAYAKGGAALRPPCLARSLRWRAEDTARALATLRDVGLLDESPFTVNISGVPEYRLGAASPDLARGEAGT